MPSTTTEERRGAAPMIALLLGAVNSPAPTPVSARNAAARAAESAPPAARPAVPAATSSRPSVAGSVTPTRSEKCPLAAATASMPAGTAIIHSPTRAGSQPAPSRNRNGIRNATDAAQT